MSVGRMVFACAGAAEITDHVGISLPRETPLGRKDPRVCLGIGRPPKMSLNDVEPERDED